MTTERSSAGEFICDGTARISRHGKRLQLAGLYRLKRDSSMKRQDCDAEEHKERAYLESGEQSDRALRKGRGSRCFPSRLERSFPGAFGAAHGGDDSIAPRRGKGRFIKRKSPCE